LLETWNATAADYPRDRCLHELVAEQAARTPDAVAVACGGKSLTYRELNRRANRLARLLRSRGVGPDVLVAVCAERSVELVVGLLAVLKAGGAYLPVDPAYPAERVAFMLEDAGVTALLTQRSLLEHLPETDARLLCLDGNWETMAADDADHSFDPAATPDSLAYVIYTSGSTGRPKGAMIDHRGLVNYLWWAVSAYQAAGGEGAPVHSSVSFDLTVTSLWSPLLVGRRVELVPEAAGIEGLTAALQAPGGFSLLKITPAHLELIRTQLPPGQAAASTRALVIGGEALLPESLAYWRENAPGTGIINEYGPTETVVGCCVYWVKPGEALGASVPIGRPIANTRLYILDRHMQPVPVGVSGELYIGGDGVCRGYLNRPELTAERFIPSPFVPGDRLYKTGDLCRYLPDGNIDFLGRIDHQVKIRGYRIELGEIESALTRHPAVETGVVLVREECGGKRLVAYAVPRAGSGLTAAALREALKAGLPEYMVPSAFVLMDALPLTPNGKVDRAALPAPDAADPEGEYCAPRTPAEAKLAAIWAEVLGVGQVSVLDNFFELGGDSILSIQVVARAAQVGLKLSPQHLFQHPTVAELAAVATEEAAGAGEGPVAGPVALTPIQRWFLDAAPAEPHHFNQAVLLELKRPLAPDALRAALGALINRHDALRLRFRQTEAGWVQEVAPQGEAPPVAWIDLARLPEAARAGALETAAAELQAGLDLAAGPLVKAALFDLGPGQPGRLLLAIHHLAVDGVSWRILLEELEMALAGSALPPQTTAFSRWAGGLGQSTAEDERAFWLGQTGGAPLPVDHAGGDNTVAQARTITLALPPAETRA
ncbi:MAG TPA: amino acid adenylation domain-containing protein, partial [Symbiobacteriaceae bacterium]|nr:amino acid adenylation domain-containing protein [Symbiobacteriaceae bacterium]